MNPNETLAIYKTAELLSILNPLSTSSLIEISHELNISHFKKFGFRIKSFLRPYYPGRKTWVQFLVHVYSFHSENFPIIILKILEGTEFRLFALNLMRRDKIRIHEVVNALNRSLSILGLEIKMLSSSRYEIHMHDNKIDYLREKEVERVFILLER